MRPLANNYSFEIDKIDKDSWHQIIKKFEDANIYQTWSYNEVLYGKKQTSHIVLKKNGQIVSAAQLRIISAPFLAFGIAYIRWGPLWRLSSQETEHQNLIQILRAIYNEYAIRRKLIIRILPLLYDNSDADFFYKIFRYEGYIHNQEFQPERTLIIDLNHEIENLRKGLKQKWRNCLNYAERQSCKIHVGTDNNSFTKFVDIYENLVDRKKFMPSVDIYKFRLIQKDLPKSLKMKILLCSSEENFHSGAIISTIGTTGIYLFGAINENGMKTKGSYLIQWEIVNLLKENKLHWYDLHGINPEKNPGTYRFKSGLSGKNGIDIQFLGRFEASQNLFIYRLFLIFEHLIIWLKKIPPVFLRRFEIPFAMKNNKSKAHDNRRQRDNRKSLSKSRHFET